MAATYLSVSFEFFFSDFSSSSVISLSFSSFLNLLSASFLIFLIATFPSSASFFTTFTYSFLLSSVNYGTTSLIILPSFEGLNPKFACKITFSIAGINDLSQGSITNLIRSRNRSHLIQWRRSSVGTTPSNIPTFALPALMCENLTFVLSTVFCILLSVSFIISLTILFSSFYTFYPIFTSLNRL